MHVGPDVAQGVGLGGRNDDHQTGAERPGEREPRESATHAESVILNGVGHRCLLWQLGFLATEDPEMASAPKASALVVSQSVCSGVPVP
jgi:hypothetical protein